MPGPYRRAPNSSTANLSTTSWLLARCDDFDRLNGALGKAAATLLILMVALQSLIIFLRAAFNIGGLASQDGVLYMHAAVIMLCLAWTWKEDGHVRVDVFYHRFSTHTRNWINCIGNIVFLLPFATFIFFSSVDYARESWLNSEASGDAGGLNNIYILKALIPLAGALLFLQGLSDTLRRLIALTYKDA